MEMLREQAYTMKDLHFWKIVVSLFLASFFIFAALYLVHPLMPIFIEEFDVSVSYSSLSLSLTVFGMIIGLLVHGYLSDRIGRTVFIKLSLFGSVIPFIVIPLFNSFIILLIFRFLQGIALAGLPAAALAYIGEEIDRQGLGLATALYIGSNALGGMIGRFVTGFIVEQTSWQFTFYLWAGIGIIILLTVMLLLPKSRYFTPINKPIKEDITAYFLHLKNPSLILLFIMGIILQLSFTGMWTYLPLHIVGEPFYLPLKIISFLYLAYGFGIVGSSIASMLIETFPLNIVRFTGIIVLSVGIFLTLGNTIILVIIGLCLACLGFFTAHSLTATKVNLIATHHKGIASSLYLAAYYVGVSMGSTIFAPVWEWKGWYGVISIGGVLPVVYMVLQYIFLRKEKKACEQVSS